MRISILAVGRRLPAWVNTAIREYHRRLPADLRPQIIEIAPARRGRKYDAWRAMQEEGDRIRDAIPESAHIIILDEQGKQPDSRAIAARLEHWRLENTHVAFVIGGADGLDPEIKDRAAESWSLSRLTLPHGIARVLLLEQLYRAWSILNNHPYHRE